MTDFIEEDIHSDHEYSDEFEEGIHSPLTKQPSSSSTKIPTTFSSLDVQRTNTTTTTVTTVTQPNVVNSSIRQSIDEKNKVSTVSYHPSSVSSTPSRRNTTTDQQPLSSSSSTTFFTVQQPQQQQQPPRSYPGVRSSSFTGVSTQEKLHQLQAKLLLPGHRALPPSVVNGLSSQVNNNNPGSSNRTTASVALDLLEQIAIDTTIGTSRPTMISNYGNVISSSSSSSSTKTSSISTSKYSTVIKAKPLLPLRTDDDSNEDDNYGDGGASSLAPSSSGNNDTATNGMNKVSNNLHGGSPSHHRIIKNKKSSITFRGPSLQDEEIGITPSVYQERLHRLSTFPSQDTTTMMNKDYTKDPNNDHYTPSPMILTNNTSYPETVEEDDTHRNHQPSQVTATNAHQQAHLATRLLRNKLYDLPYTEENDNYPNENTEHNGSNPPPPSSLSQHYRNTTEAMGASPQFIPPPLTSLLRHQQRNTTSTINNNAMYHRKNSSASTSLPPGTLRKSLPQSKYNNNIDNASALPLSSSRKGGSSTNHSKPHGISQPMDYHNAITSSMNQHPPYGFKEKVALPTVLNSVNNSHLPAYTHANLRSHITDGTSAAKALGLIPSEYINPQNTPWGGAIPIMVPGIDGNPRTLYLCETVPTVSMPNGVPPPPVPVPWLPVSEPHTKESVKGTPQSSSLSGNGAAGLVPLSDDVLAQIFLLSTITGKNSREKANDQLLQQQAQMNGFLALTSSVINTEHNYLHNVNNTQAIRLLQYSNQTPLATTSSSTTTREGDSHTFIGSVSSNKYDTTPTPLELAAQWSTVFDELYKETIVHLPSLIINSVINLSRLKNTTDTNENTTNDKVSSLPIPLPLNLAIASPLSTALTDMLTDVDVVTLIREAVAARIQARIVEYGMQTPSQSSSSTEKGKTTTK